VSIYKDQSGRWHGYVSLELTDHGRRDRRHVSGRRRDDVQRKVRELERRRDEGVGSVTGRQVTVDSWLHHWLDTIAAPKVRPSTLRRDRACSTPRHGAAGAPQPSHARHTSPDPSRPTTPSSTRIEQNPVTLRGSRTECSGFRPSQDVQSSAVVDKLTDERRGTASLAPSPRLVAVRGT
jgi:hypothetical protein